MGPGSCTSVDPSVPLVMKLLKFICFKEHVVLSGPLEDLINADNSIIGIDFIMIMIQQWVALVNYQHEMNSREY